MTKQRCLCLCKDDLVKLLKEKMDWLPDDLEICSVEQLERSTIIAITVHSDEFIPLYSKLTYPLYSFADAKEGWEEMENRYIKGE